MQKIFNSIIMLSLTLNLEAAVQDNKVMQDFELESLLMGVDHSQKVKAPPTGDYDSNYCVNLLPSTAVSRLNTLTLEATKEEGLYPTTSAYAEGYLKVSESHQIFYALYGNPQGIPVVVLHGGPGLGFSNEYTNYFDLDKWHVLMFDQRGAKRSKPSACMEENTTQNSIADIETLRILFGVEKWVVFGNSWGSCLALCYGQAYPESCLGFILQGTFLGRDKDIRLFDNLENNTSEAYKEFLTNFSEEEQKDLLASSYRKIMDPNPEVYMKMAHALLRFHLLTISTPPEIITYQLSDDRRVLSFARAAMHYIINHFFLERDQILINMSKIDHLRGIIIHGKMDSVCSVEQSYLLHENWGNSLLLTIDGAGHSCLEPGISHALAETTRAFVLDYENNPPYAKETDE